MPVANRLALLLPLVAVLCGPQVLAQQSARIPDLPDQLPIQLTVRPTIPGRPQTQDTIVQIDPGWNLSLQFELTWSGDQPVTIYWGNLHYGDWVRLSIETPLETKLVTSHLAPVVRPDRAHESQIVTLQPGESATGSLQVGAGTAGHQMFRFLEPGRYELTATVEIHVTGGDPAFPESWQSLGRVTAPPATFDVGFGNDPGLDYRLVRGQVTDADGDPVPHADVYVHVERTAHSFPSGGKRFQTYDRAVTDEQGQYAFPSIPAGEPRLMLGVMHGTLPPADQTVAPDPATDELEVNFQLSPGRTIRGRVVDPEGRPLSGVALGRPRVSWMWTSDEVVTGPDGRFEIHGVSTEAAGIPAHRRDLEIVDDSNRIDAGRESTTIEIIMQPRQSPGELTGIARFENGEPARNMDVTLWIELADQNTRNLRGRTDGDGRFALELTSELVEKVESLTGVAELGGEPESEVRDRWMARFDAPPGERELELEFRREHSLTVNLTSVIPLPVDLNVLMTVSARPSYGSRMLFSRTYRGSHLSPSTLHDLTPGRYRVDVQLQEASHYDWSEDLVIPFDDPQTDHEVSFEIPEIHFGTLHVEVRYPDGRKPADRTTVWMDANKAHGWQHVYDGVATFQVVPVGPVTVQHNERNGIVGLPIRGEIEADKETTLGPLVLRPVEDAYGHVSGRVLLADGTPALGSGVTLQQIVSSSVSLVGGNKLVSGSGAFRVSDRPGTEFLVVNLKGCDLWPPGSVVEQATTNFSFGLSADVFKAHALTRSVVRPVTLVGGEEQTIDVTLPDVSFRDVTLELPDGQNVHVTLWTNLGDTWMHAEGGLEQDNRRVFRNVPDRPTRLLLTGWDAGIPDRLSHRGAAVVDVPAGDAPVVRADLSRTGTLRIRSDVPAEDGHRLWYRVRLDGDELPALLSTLVGVGEVDERVLDEEGFVPFRLAPGRYVVTALLDGEEREITVELREGMEERVEFRFGSQAE